jgi:hypothetical protein
MDKDKCDHATPRSDSVPGDSFSVAEPSADILREDLFYPATIGDAGSTISLARLMHKNDRSAIDPEKHWSQGSFVLRLRGLRPRGKRFMRGSLRAAACFPSIVTAALILLASATGALAEDKRTVQAAASVVIVPPSEKVIADKSGPLKGTVSVIESTTTPKTYSLIYLAPKTGVDFTDAVKYSDGTDHTVLVSVTAGGEPPTLTSPEIYAQSFKALFVLFIIAIILESGLAVIFNWRPFIQLFDARGVKTIVSFLFAWLFVSAFDLDIVTNLVNVYSQKSYLINFPGTFVTALVLAGGSSGVNNLLVALGFRSVKTADQAAPKLPPTEAWISVRLIRAAAVGPVTY